MDDEITQMVASEFGGRKKEREAQEAAELGKTEVEEKQEGQQRLKLIHRPRLNQQIYQQMILERQRNYDDDNLQLEHALGNIGLFGNDNGDDMLDTYCLMTMN